MEQPQPSVITPTILKIIHGMATVPYFNYAALAMYTYDWALTLDMEINQVWLKKWDFIEIVYLFQRYAVVLDACVLAIYRQTGSDMTDVKCDRVKWIVAAVMVLGTLSSEVILTARVWALWNRTTRLLTILCALGVVIWVPGVVGLYRFFVTVKAPPKPIYKGFHGCFPNRPSTSIKWWWLSLCVWDTLCMALVLKPAIQFRRLGMASRMPLSLIIYRDGILFYLCLFLCSIVNVISYWTFPVSFRVIGSSLSRCLHAMLASRALLQMREQFQRQNASLSLNDSGEFSISGIGMGVGSVRVDSMGDGDGDVGINIDVGVDVGRTIPEPVCDVDMCDVDKRGSMGTGTGTRMSLERRSSHRSHVSGRVEVV